MSGLSAELNHVVPGRLSGGDEGAESLDDNTLTVPLDGGSGLLVLTGVVCDEGFRTR